jgi:hypothetical protein
MWKGRGGKNAQQLKGIQTRESHRDTLHNVTHGTRHQQYADKKSVSPYKNYKSFPKDISSKKMHIKHYSMTKLTIFP